MSTIASLALNVGQQWRIIASEKGKEECYCKNYDKERNGWDTFCITKL